MPVISRRQILRLSSLLGLSASAWPAGARVVAASPATRKLAELSPRTSPGGVNVLRYIPAAEWPAIQAGTSTYDATADIQAAWDAEKHIFVPRGVYRIDPGVGLVFQTGYKLTGAGKNQAILRALPGGRTLAQLAGYQGGSMLRRAYKPGVFNEYVSEVQLSDVALVMSPSLSGIASDTIQIGLDLRNVTRTVIERVHIGNVPPPGGALDVPDPGRHAIQGYCLVIGNVSSGARRAGGYCGGEVHSVRDCALIGGYKLLVQDDLVLTPRSAAHAVTVEGCDFQAGHHLLVQESRYATGNVWRNNTLQNVRRQSGNDSPTCVMRVAGYNNDIQPGYIEAGTTDYLLRFDAESKNNRARLSHFSATRIGIAAVSDAGRRNRVDMFADTGALAGGVDSQGAPVVLYDRGYLSPWIKCHWDGSSMVKDGGQGMSAARSGLGDYVFTFALPFFEADSYSLEISIGTRPGDPAGSHDVYAHSAAEVRIRTYTQRQGGLTPVDPHVVWVRARAAGD